eukprot:54102-Prorocentrum_minimum.AAC.1
MHRGVKSRSGQKSHSPGHPLVNFGFTPGQLRVNSWSASGQLLVSFGSTPGQLLVNSWSTPGQLLPVPADPRPDMRES